MLALACRSILSSIDHSTERDRGGGGGDRISSRPQVTSNTHGLSESDAAATLVVSRTGPTGLGVGVGLNNSGGGVDPLNGGMEASGVVGAGGNSEGVKLSANSMARRVSVMRNL